MAAQHAQALRSSGGLARARGAGGRRAVRVRSAPSRRAAQRHLLAIRVRDHLALLGQEVEQGALVVEGAHEKAVPVSAGRGSGQRARLCGAGGV